MTSQNNPVAVFVSPEGSKGLISCFQMPDPCEKPSLRYWAWEMLLPGATLRVSQTLPPMIDPRPMVIRPRIVALA